MTEIQCILTPEGKRALDNLLNQVYPHAKKRNKAKISAHTDLTRDTINRILGTEKQPEPKPVQRQTLEHLFSCLNKQIKQNYRDANPQGQKESGEAYKKRIGESLKSLYQCPFRNQYWTDDIDAAHQSTAIASSLLEPVAQSVGYLSDAQTLAHLLWKLDYAKEEEEFTTTLCQLNRSGAFMVRCHDTKVQGWLVKRLAKAAGFFEMAEKISINMGSLSRIDELWDKFPKKLRRSPVSSKSMIEDLSKLCQERPVIIVLSRFQRADKTMQHQIINEFWMPLLNQVNTASRRSWRSRLVLFLVEEGGDIHIKTVSPDEAKNSEYPVLLPPLIEIKSGDVRDWFKDDVFELLVQRRGDGEAEAFMRNNNIASPGSTPWNTLENICNEFRYDITEIEPSWRLAG
ncbi:MAG: hypothetical protein LH679_02655 [Cyanobacteria bacterium CAN_BIN43]|nr:hypothetical protein [Cyanobacteria bacterium CAN_BIN43]